MIEFIYQNEAIVRFSAFFIGLFLLAVWEYLRPKRKTTQSRVKRWMSNISLLLVSTAVLRLIVPIAAVSTAYMLDANSGFVNQFDLPFWAKVTIAFVLLDLSIYIQHNLFHSVPTLWRVHRVHHSDMDCDVTTGLRFHPIEIVLSILIKVVTVTLLGAPVLAVILLEIHLNFMSMFTHSNIRLNKNLDKVLRWFIVTPNMHELHHSLSENETNSNFGFNISLWDRIFGTYMDQSRTGESSIVLGLDHYREPKWQGPLGLLAMPFAKGIGGYAINYRDAKNEEEIMAAKVIKKKNRENLQLLRDLNKSNAQLKNATRIKNIFLANMSHEIRTPLTAIIGFAETLKDAGQSRAQKRSSVNTIIRCGNHLLHIINDILDLSKIEENKLEIELIKTNLISTLEEVKPLAEMLIQEKGISFEVDYQFPLPETINTDPVRLKQIIFNLVSNAIKFTESGGVRLVVSHEADAGMIQIEVIDTGIGMREDQLSLLFNAFSQADVSTTRKYGGTGLGLFLSKSLANKLGGNIDVKSQVDIGSTFRATIATGSLQGVNYLTSLPQLGVEVEEATHNGEQQKYNANILVVDDNKDNQALVSVYLSKLGVNVTLADNGQIAVDYALAEPFDMILMDIQMPVLNGVEATKLLRENGYNGVILSLSANVMKSDMELYQRSGFTDSLSKPINRKIFLRTISHYLEHNGKRQDDGEPGKDAAVSNA